MLIGLYCCPAKFIGMDWAFALRLEVAGGAFLPLFDMRSATVLREVCTELRTAVAEHAWADGSRIKGSLAAWRAGFSRARQANIRGRKDLVDADFVHLAGIHTLDMRGCKQASITDAAFVHLAGIHKLDMSECRQDTITDAAFVHLAGIHVLDMSFCSQATITDAAFVHLAGIYRLILRFCKQGTITGATFRHLAGVGELGVAYCNQDTINAASILQKHASSTLCY